MSKARSVRCSDRRGLGHGLSLVIVASVAWSIAAPAHSQAPFKASVGFHSPNSAGQFPVVNLAGSTRSGEVLSVEVTVAPFQLTTVSILPVSGASAAGTRVLDVTWFIAPSFDLRRVLFAPQRADANGVATLPLRLPAAAVGEAYMVQAFTVDTVAGLAASRAHEFTVVPADARAFYVDPVAGDDANDGSQASPWRNLSSVLASKVETQRFEVPYSPSSQLIPKNVGAPVHGGDTIFLMDGDHGDVFLRGAHNEIPVVLASAPGHQPVVQKLRLQAVARWRLVGLTVSQEPSGQNTGRNNMVHIESHSYHGPSSDVTVEGCSLYSARDTSAWTVTDWTTLADTAIHCSGPRMRLVGNTILNVDFGVIANGHGAVIQDNTVTNFAGDGMRPGGDDMVVQFNTIKNCYDVDGNHDDGIQVYVGPAGGSARNVYRGNTIISSEDPQQPFRGTLQGIGFFDGPYIDYVIENNVVMVEHWHGITVNDAVGCRIVNNTAVNHYQNQFSAWIRLGGSGNRNNVIRNNISGSFQYPVGTTTFDHNLLLSDRPGSGALPEDVFVDLAGLDLHLKSGSPAVDAGNSVLAPTVDRDNARRSVGGVDIGAYEYL